MSKRLQVVCTTSVFKVFYCLDLFGHLLRFLDYPDTLRLECASRYCNAAAKKFGPGTQICIYRPELFSVLRPMRYVRCLKIISIDLVGRLPDTIVTIVADIKTTTDRTLMYLPNKLESLTICQKNQDDFSSCTVTNAGMVHLPSTLKHLNLRHCQRLQPGLVFPKTLMSLELNNCINVTALVLPQTLKKLTLTFCPYIAQYPEFPESLETLSCQSHGWNDRFPENNNIKTLDLQHYNYYAIHNLPTTLTSLDISCSAIKCLDELPETLRVLKAVRCPYLNHVDRLPNSITNLNLSDSTNIVDLDHLPSELTHLSISGLRVTNLDHLPSKLTHLIMVLCTRISEIDHLPQTLVKLNMGFTHITRLNHLPDSIVTLNLGNTVFLKELKRLPKSIKRLIMLNSNIKCIDHIPKSVNVDYYQRSTYLRDGRC